MHLLPRAYIPIGRKWIARVRCDLEHIINDAKIITRENIALLCIIQFEQRDKETLGLAGLLLLQTARH